MKKILLLIAVLPFFNQKKVNAQCSFSLSLGFSVNTIWGSPDSMNLRSFIDPGDSIAFEYGFQGFSIGNGTRVGFRRGEQEHSSIWNSRCNVPKIKTLPSGHGQYRFDFYAKVYCMDTSGVIQDSSNYTMKTYFIKPDRYFSEYLNVNNISAQYLTNGQLFSNPSTGNGGYFIDQRKTIHASSLWFGGKDANDSLHLSALRYANVGSGNLNNYATDITPGTGQSLQPSIGDSCSFFEFYPGPIGNCDSASLNNYNRFWKVTQSEIDAYIDWYQCGITPGCTPDPNYVIPEAILSWPGNGYIPCGHNEFIAPFNDLDLDGLYEPQEGETPCIKGDMALFHIYNDKGPHYHTGGTSLDIIVRAMHYGYSDSTNPALHNTIFSDYAILNNSQNTYTDFYVSNWADMDIGCYGNDYVGSDPTRGLYYTYNGTSVDNGCSQGFGFGDFPPAQGICVLRGLKKENDSQDNPLTNDVNLAIAQDGIPYDGLGCGYGDGIVDNERVGLANMMYMDYTLNNVAMSDPQIASEYYDLMQNKWRDGSNLVYGGIGHQNNAPVPLQNTSFSLPGNNDPLNWGTASQGSGNTVPYGNWSEEFPNGPSSSSNTPGDRRLVGSIGPTTLYPFNGNIDNIQEFTLAYITARPDSVNNVNPVTLLQQYTDQIRSTFACDQNGMYGNCSSLIASNNDEATPIANVNEIRIYPNPANQTIFLSSNVNIKEVTVLDLTGKIVLKKDANSNLEQLDVSSFKNGLYLLKISDENQMFYVEQFIKN